MSDIIYPNDTPKIMGEKITEFLEKCEEAELIISKIVFEPGTTVKAEIVV